MSGDIKANRRKLTSKIVNPFPELMNNYGKKNLMDSTNYHQNDESIDAKHFNEYIFAFIIFIKNLFYNIVKLMYKKLKLNTFTNKER